MRSTPSLQRSDSLRWDVFCEVVDNHGDAGVAWRLSADLAARGQAVRLWIDRPDALPEVATALGDPDGAVEVRLWNHATLQQAQGMLNDPPQVIVECFGCKIAMPFIADCAHQLSKKRQKLLWINLEYMTAEAYAERSHTLPSPVFGLPPECERLFFYPGFSPRTGGLLREADLASRQGAFLREPQHRNALLAQLGLPPAAPGERLMSLFCYEPPLLPVLLQHLADGPQTTRLLVTPGRATQAVQTAVHGLFLGKKRDFPNTEEHGQLLISYLPWLPQQQYDELLWACDFNCVRGEDSLVRALWAGQPFVWQIYPQNDGAHLPKLDAFLDWLGADAAWRAFMRAWNGSGAPPSPLGLSPIDLTSWQAQTRTAQARLLAQPDLVSALLRFVRKRLNLL